MATDDAGRWNGGMRLFWPLRMERPLPRFAQDRSTEDPILPFTVRQIDPRSYRNASQEFAFAMNLLEARPGRGANSAIRFQADFPQGQRCRALRGFSPLR